MKINATTLQNLDASKSYYLSNSTGEIKKAGFVQWFKCFFNIGDGRAKAAALADRVKEALLADGAVAGDATLDGDIRALDTTKSLSGAALRDIATRFRASHSEAVGRADAKRLAETIADESANDWVQSRWIYPDPPSVAQVKKLAVYAASSVIKNASKYATQEELGSALRNKINLLNAYIGSVGEMSAQTKLGYPTAQTYQLENGKKVGLLGTKLKFDELHFRLFVANMADHGGDFRIDLTKFLDISEENVQEWRAKLLKLPMKDPADPEALPAFAAEFKKMVNDRIRFYCVEHGSARNLPPSFTRAFRNELEGLRQVFGEKAVPQNANYFTYMRNNKEIVTALAEKADREGRVITAKEFVDAFRNSVRERAAATFLRDKAAELAGKEGRAALVDVPFGERLLKRDTKLRDELLACKTSDEAAAAVAKHEDAIRAQLDLKAELEGARGKATERAAEKIASATGLDVNTVLERTDFTRLKTAVGTVAGKIESGTEPGCMEKGFDAGAALEKALDGFVKTRVDLMKEVDAQEGVSGETKQLWKMQILATNKPDLMHAAQIAAIAARRGGEIGQALASALEPGLPENERAKRFSIAGGCMNAAFVELFGQDKWEDMGPDERDPVFTMLAAAVLDKMPDFAAKYGAASEDLAGISQRAFNDNEAHGPGQKVYLLVDSLVAQPAQSAQPVQSA